MNSYSFGLSIPWWLALIFFIVGLVFTIYTYRITVPPISNTKRVLLITLRTIGITILLFVLFEPILTIISGWQEPPRLAVLYDYSKSVGANDASGSRIEQYKKAYNNSGINSFSKDNKIEYKFAEYPISVNNFYLDSLKYNGEQTNISKALKQIYTDNAQNNLRAFLMFTDGAFNAGANPIYNAEEIGKPIYIIGIGDTNMPKDISIQSIITNEIGYINNPIPISINVLAAGFPNQEVTVKLLDNGKQFAEQKLTLHQDKNEYSLLFDYQTSSEGIHKITASVSNLDGEITTQNNVSSEFIKILKNKRKISIFAGSPDADVSFIKNTISKEKGVEITLFSQKKGSDFYDPQPTTTNIKESELIIFVGFPISSTPESVLNLIKNELQRGKSFMFIASRYIDYKKLSFFDEYLPFKIISSKNQEFLALTDVKNYSLSSPMLRVTGSDEDLKLWNSLPPIFRTETFVKSKPESEVLSYLKINNVPLQEPLIISRNFQNKKSLAIIGYGLYRWKLLGYAPEVAKGRKDAIDLYDIFIQNSIRWLSIEDKDKQVKIRTNKTQYLLSEKVEFTAQIYDAAYNPLDNAQVKVKISSGNEQREVLLGFQSNGKYTSSIEGLPKGDYSFTGTATVNGNTIGSDNGRFSVGDIDIEYQNLQMNINLLRTIAERTGGKFYMPDQANNFLNDLKNHSDFTTKSIQTKNEYPLWNIAWLLSIVIICFACEWFLRKKYGMV